jgi:hypothetical protein
MISILEVWFQSYNDLLAKVPHLALQIFYIFALLLDLLDEQTPELLGALLIVLEFVRWSFKLKRILVQAVVGKVHIHVALVGLVRLLVVGGAQSHNAFVTEVSLQRVNALDQHIEPNIKLLLID